MGMGPAGGKGRRGLVADINVTPLVDVMLVLLIIFMVTAPMMTQGLEVNLPKTTNKSLNQEDKPLVITIDKDGQVFIKKLNLSLSLLHQQLSKMPEDKKKETVYLRADEAVPYGMVIKTMAEIKRAGFDKLGMVTQPAAPKK